MKVIICENLNLLGLKNLKRVNAEDIFLHEKVEDEGKIIGPLVETGDPEEKRKIIGNLFIKVVRDAASELGFDFNKTFLAQGTLRPDLIESGNPDVSSYAHKIKTHHNDVNFIREARKRGMIVETNWDWHKDEVRQIARQLGIEESIASRQPFPGPGLAIRYICNINDNKVTSEQITAFNEQLDNPDYKGNILPLKTVGVQGDCRSYRYLSIVYGKGMDADWNILANIGINIPNRLDFINRVGYVLNKKELEGIPKTFHLKINKEGLHLVREIDAIVREYLDKPPISQVFAVLIPAGIDNKYSIAIRTFITNDYMTGRPAIIGKDISHDTINKLVNRIETEFKEIDLIIYDVTAKPPATVEWE